MVEQSLVCIAALMANYMCPTDEDREGMDWVFHGPSWRPFKDLIVRLSLRFVPAEGRLGFF